MFEVCIGVDPARSEAQERAWAAFGFVPSERGALTRQAALVLYGVGSALTSVRLRHESRPDVGHVRLMTWERPTGPGAALAPFHAPGARWAVSATQAIARVWNHAEAAAALQEPIEYSAPAFFPLPSAAPAPWTGAVAGARRMRLIEPLCRRVLEQDFDFGAAAEDWRNAFGGGPIRAVGACVAARDPATLEFYSQVLGLTFDAPARLIRYEDLSRGEQILYALSPGDGYWRQAFLAPGAPQGGSMPLEVRVVEAGRWPAARARPGDLGLTTFTYAMREPRAWREALVASPARAVTPVLANEFGERAIGFDSPDGLSWQLVAA